MAEQTQQPKQPKNAEAAEELTISKRLRTPVKFQPPLMPLIDVMFTLMLFFLVSCQYRQAEGSLPGTLPSAVGDRVDKIPLREMHIVITPNGPEGAQFSFSDSGVAMANPERLFEQLEARKQAIAGATDAPIIIDVMPGVRWEHVVQAFNQTLRARFKNVGFSGE